MTELHIRIPDELAAKVRALAGEERRTLNAEIFILLERALK